MSPTPPICLTLPPRTLQELQNLLQTSTQKLQKAQLIEWRADYLHPLTPTDISQNLPKIQLPTIITLRQQAEGGFWSPDKDRLAFWQAAVDTQAAYIDIEYHSPPAEKKALQSMTEKTSTKIILSWHNFSETPPLLELQKLYRQMRSEQPDIIKIVTQARTAFDGLAVLQLLQIAQTDNQPLIALSMGTKGQYTRLLSPLLGGAWTFASLSDSQASAPGQFTISALQKLYQHFVQ